MSETSEHAPTQEIAPTPQRFCLIVYSSREPHFERVVAVVSDVVSTEMGFRALTLEEARESGKPLYDQLSKSMDSASLGIVILDGLRPNVLLELGMLFGKKVPVVLLLEKESVVNVKSFAEDVGKMGPRGPRINVDIAKHVSDISNISWRKYSAHDELGLRKILRGEIKNLSGDISARNTSKSCGVNVHTNPRLLPLLAALSGSQSLKPSAHLILVKRAVKAARELAEKDRAHFFLHVAQSLRMRKEYSPALGFVVAGLQLDKTEEWLLSERVLLLSKLGQHRDAIKYGAQAFQGCPNCEQILRSYLIALISGGKGREALRILGKYSYESLLTQDLICLKIRALLLAAKFQEAIRLSVANYLAGEKEEAFEYLIYAAARAGRITLPAEMSYRIEKILAERWGRQKIECYQCLVRGLKNLGFQEWAARAVRLAVVKLGYDNADVINEIAFDAVELAMYQEANRLLSKGLRRFPSHSYLNATKGLLFYKKTNDISEGDKWYLRAIALRPRDFPLKKMFHYQRGESLLRRRSYTKGKEALLNAKKIGGKFLRREVEKALSGIRQSG